MKIRSAPLRPFGFEVEVTSLPDNSSVETEELRSIYRQDGLLVVRGLRLSHEDQIAFCRLFGPVLDTPSENFIVSNIDANGYLGTRELLWHNDVPYLPSPYLAGCLHAVRVDPEAVGTRFASGYRAYESLPEALRERADNLNALHVRERVYDRRNRLTDLKPGDLCTVHAVVAADAETERKYLFINEAWTAQIIGLPEAESDNLLSELHGHFYGEDNVYEHHWSEGDIVLWNNLAVQHARGKAGTGVRTLQRVTLTKLGYADQYPTDLGIGTSLGNQELETISSTRR